MSSFAGSRSVDERRRRRLATTPDEVPAVSGSKGPAGKRERADRRERSVRHFPLRKLVSNKGWKLWGVGVLGLVAAVGLVVAGWSAETHAERLGPGFVRLFNLAEGRLLRGFTTLCLILAAELTLLIWWCRSRSSGDFSGHYRIWWSAAAGLLLFATIVATDGHTAAAETVTWLWGARFWKQQVMVWLVPAAVAMAVILRALQSDMRDCRLSRAMIWIAGLSWLIAGAEQLRFDIPIEVPHRNLAGVSFGLFGHWCLVMGLMLHARFVIHESAEPPAPREPRFRLRIPFPRIRLPRLRLPRLRRRATAAAESSKSPTARGAAKKRAAEPVVKASKGKPEKATPRKPTRITEEPSEQETAIEEEPIAARALPPKPAPAVRSQPAAKAEIPPAPSKVEAHPAAPSESEETESEWDDETAAEDTSGRKWRVDAGHSDDQLQGLSKKQRKKMQKQLRQQQRAGR